MCDQFRQKIALDALAYILAFELLGLACAEHVVEKDLVISCEPRRDIAPRLRRPGKTVNQDEWLTVANGSPGDFLAAKFEGFVEC